MPPRPEDEESFPLSPMPGERPGLPSGSSRRDGIPAVVARGPAAATFAWEEFFEGELPNRHTRTAYLRAARQFLAWCEGRGLALERITPGHVGQYMARHPGSVPTKKQHLAAIRGLFDRLVVRHV